MKILRTPDERFTNLKDYPFAPCYVDLGELRLHYVDEGPRDADPVLMLHGEPSWSYLYRKMIPVCAAAGHRVIAADLVGFGKSDKPAGVNDYTYQAHMDWTTAFVEALGLERITLVCQDWGALIGLRMAAENEARFARIVVGNGMLPTGDQKMPLAFKIWRAFALWSPVFPVSRLVRAGCRALDAEERRAYDAPFPSAAYKAGARAFPKLVPTSPDDPAAPANRRAWEVLRAWEKPFLTTFSSGDPIMRGGDRYMQKRVPGAAGMKHRTLRGGHFLQEDSGPEFAAAVNQLIADTPLSA